MRTVQLRKNEHATAWEDRLWIICVINKGLLNTRRRDHSFLMVAACAVHSFNCSPVLIQRRIFIRPKKPCGMPPLAAPA